MNKKISNLIIVNGGLFKNDNGLSYIYNLPTKFGYVEICVYKEYIYCFVIDILLLFNNGTNENTTTHISFITKYKNIHSRIGTYTFFFSESEINEALNHIENYFKNIVK